MFIFIFLVITLTSSAMDNSATSLHYLARYGKATEFAQALEKSSEADLFKKLPNGNTILHEVAYPYFSNENPQDAQVINKELTNEQLHHAARKHAFIADLILRKGANKLLNEVNLKNQTASYLAAKTGYLPVLGRLMLSNPCDSGPVISLISSINMGIIIDSFLHIVNLKNNPNIPVYPTMPTDLHIELSSNQWLALEEWARKAKSAFPQLPNLSELDIQARNYLFESYLLGDILSQYRANPTHPLAKAYLTRLNESQP